MVNVMNSLERFKYLGEIGIAVIGIYMLVGGVTMKKMGFIYIGGGLLVLSFLLEFIGVEKKDG